MNSRNSMLRHYFQNICSYLPCSGKLKKQILMEIRTNISNYLEEFPAAEFSQIEARFGTPQSIAAAYVADMDTEELLQAHNIRKKIVTTVISCVLIVLFMWGATVTAAFINVSQRNTVYIEKIVEEVAE